MTTPYFAQPDKQQQGDDKMSNRAEIPKEIDNRLEFQKSMLTDTKQPLLTPKWLEEINQWLLTVERPRISIEGREWNDSFTGRLLILKRGMDLTQTGLFTEQFIKESYPGGGGDFNV